MKFSEFIDKYQDEMKLMYSSMKPVYYDRIAFIDKEAQNIGLIWNYINRQFVRDIGE